MSGRDDTDGFTEYTRYLDFTRFAQDARGYAVLAQREFAIGVGEEAREMPVGIVSASFWSFFDARPALGRYFTARRRQRSDRHAGGRAELRVLAGAVRRIA